jgi:ATP-binding cassette, subfamily B, bacterial
MIGARAAAVAIHVHGLRVMVATERKPASIVSRLRTTIRLGRALRLVWRSSPRLTGLNLGITVLQGLVPLAALYLLKLIIDEVTAGVAGAPVEFNRILLLIGLAAFVAILEVVLRTVGNLASEAHSMEITDHVHSMLHAKSAVLDLEHYEDVAYQDLVHQTQREATVRPAQVLRSLLGIARSLITLAGIVVLLATAGGMLILLLFVAAFPSLGVKLRFANRMHRWMKFRAPTERLASYLNLLLTHPTFAKDIRMAELAPVFGSRFRDTRRMIRTEGLRINRSRGLGEMAAQSVAVLAVFAGFFLIARDTLAGVLTVGGLVMYLQALQRGQAVFTELAGGVGSLYEHNLFLSHLDEFMALQPAIVAPEHPAPIPRPLRTGLQVEGVGFQYPSASGLSLKNAHLSVSPGEMVAVVGANGSGKTTLMKLICRLYDPTYGRILLDGRDIREYDPLELRRQISIVYQDFIVYAFSTAENIWFGNARAPRDDERIAYAARQAGADRVVARFANGLDTPLNKLFAGGQDVSGGEAQKVALARAFYSDAQLLILDEPSSALDAQAEIELFDHIRREASDRSVIVISHRFSTVRMADRIYVLEDGTVTESGTHDQLLAQGGTYARLFDLQASAYTEGGAAVNAEQKRSFDGIGPGAAGLDSMPVPGREDATV